jgi:hypothetical protein
MRHEHFHKAHNGRPVVGDRVEIEDTIVVERLVGSSPAAAEQTQELEFEVVGIVADPAEADRYAVCYCESLDEFIVTDEAGALLKNETLAQEILEDFLEQAADSAEEDS